LINLLIGTLRGFFSVESERLRLGSTGIGSRPIPMGVGNSHFTGVKPSKGFPSVSSMNARARGTVAAAVKVDRAEAVSAPAPQQRKALPAGLCEERRTVRDDQRGEAGGRTRQ
jgi:hypothetical protein